MKVLIVDDEVVIREAIKDVICWEEYGYEVIEPAGSAEDAILKMERYAPEIMITDIKMGGKSGLDLAKYVKEMNLLMEMIVLTGYDDFEFVQEALRKGVGDYLLKNSNPDEILAAVHEAKERLLEKRKERDRKKMEDIRGIEESIQQLIISSDALSLNETALQLIPQSHHSVYKVVIIKQSITGDQLKEMEKIWNKYLFGLWVSIQDQTIIVVHQNSQTNSDYLLKMASKKVCQQLRSTLLIGEAVHKLEQLSISYRSAQSLILYQWILTDLDVINPNDVQHRAGIKSSNFIKEKEEELVGLITRGQAEDLEMWLNTFMQYLLRHPHATPDSIHFVIQSLYITKIRFMNRAAQSIGKPEWDVITLPDTNQWLSDINVLLSYFERLRREYQNVMNEHSNFIHVALHVMEENLNESLTLSDIANKVHVHPNYLSESLKKKTGKPYVELMKEMRMKKAQELLLSLPAPVRQIASQVGYTDWKYFASQFKKYTGMTPTQYREKEKEDV
ncbi:two-component system, response regulator YesN [Gracilibacillus orientalis]|uniref:Two-component system, response regulator YesN n=1 Tax=Gracilibacillus orientalis TaxID=334253 RepID=A0A1I4HYZ8_9BACI|nr:response regulator [Gracilibacillus orientalis]SFL46953.1 two-component system, response regulator YesN [Gracilibacillus orientalis]